MLNLTKKKYFYYIAFMLMTTTFLPLLYVNLPPIVRSHHVWTLLWMFSLLIYHPQILINKRMVYIYSFVLLLIIVKITIWSDLSNWYLKQIFYELYIFVIGISVITYFLQIKDYVNLAKITRWSIIFIFITAIMTIVSATIDPLYARKLVAISEVTQSSEREILLDLRRYGGGNYSSAGAFMCLFPIFIYYYKNIIISLLSKRMLIVLCVVFFIALLAMQILSNILIAFGVIVIAMFSANNKNWSMWIVTLFIIVILSIPDRVFISGFQSVSNIFSEYSELSSKFDGIATFIEGNMDIQNPTGIGGRMKRYPLLLNAFVNSPLRGAFSTIQGMKVINDGGGFHLYWMYKLATFGIIVFLAFLYIPYVFIKNNLRYFIPTYKFYYILASLAVITYGLVKHIGGRETWYVFFVILPGLYFLPLLKKNH